MRVRALTAAALGAALILAGCGGGGGSGTGGEPVELTWWMLTQDAEAAGEAIDQAVADFQTANPGITVNVEYRAVDPLKDALRTSAGSGEGPDVYFMWAGPGLGGEFVEAGVDLDLTRYYDQYGWRDRFNEGTLQSYTQYGDGIHGVPWTQRGEVVFYNRTLFERAGITEPPATYDALVDTAARLTAAGITPMAFGGKENWHVMRMLDSLVETNCGAELGDQLNTMAASWADQPCVAKSFTDLQTWGGQYFNPGYVGLGQAEAASLFFTGQAAMTIEGDWYTEQITAGGGNIEDYGVFTFPTGTDRLYGFGEGLFISRSSAHPDEAARFLDYMTSDEVQAELAPFFSATSVNQNVQLASGQNAVQDAMASTIAEASDYYVNNDQNFPTDITTEYWRIQNAVLTGSIAPADAGAQFQQFIDGNR